MGKGTDKEHTHRSLAPVLQRLTDSAHDNSTWGVCLSLPNNSGAPGASDDPPCTQNETTNQAPVAPFPWPRTPDVVEISHRQYGSTPPHLSQEVVIDTESLRDLNFASLLSDLPSPNILGRTPPTESTYAPICLQKNILGSAVRSRGRSKTPRIRVCLLCTGGRELPVLEDVSLIMKGLAHIRGVDPEHIITRTSKMIDVALDIFFDRDIREGDLLILIMSCHGYLIGNHVILEFKTQDGTLVNSRMLQQKIEALPDHCTLEVIVDTCHAEGIVPGLRRISSLDPSSPSSSAMLTSVHCSAAPHTIPSELRRNTRPIAFCSTSNIEPSTNFPGKGLFKHVSPLFGQPQPNYKAKVVVWAASEMLGMAYPEADLPTKAGVYSIMIGAIFNYFSSKRPKITRQEVWGGVLKLVEEQNNARQDRDSRKSPEQQARLKKENRIQKPVLLTSVDNPDRVLSGRMFHAIQWG
ncbi:unnamed protein product [Rhizoctonia solani]|uniref:Uncharacterized protein n=1 Tax=Rhizoctonia solani TaxID=456999 RepID=A0A8H2W994_9AGAM|nr:unnamed protein product [Rhizoctonia solani]